MTTPPFAFGCLTDDIRPEVLTRTLPRIDLGGSEPRSPWCKVSLFSPELADLEGSVLSLDLAVVGPLDDLFDYAGRFCVIENWTTPGSGIGSSNVFGYQPGARVDVFDRFARETIWQTYDNSQTCTTRAVGDVTFWPAT